MNSNESIQSFLAGDVFAVAGASTERHKYGNKVLRCYLQNDRTVYPVNPNADVVEGLAAFPTLQDLPEPVHGLSIITPPAVTEQIVEDAIQAGIKHIWMQPGAENSASVAAAQEAGINVIAGGPCLLVVMGYREE
ncbi:CoA-binding protein [Thalassoglobus sp. JC818]|uniref:CoA-binding protein n=1 Tax=Thalassoglobus sp. JC818 TaxID=3232136 RepID=UPI0034588519